MSKGLELELLRPTAVLPAHVLQDQAYLEALTEAKRRQLHEVTRKAMQYGAMEQLGRLGLGKYLIEIAEILKPHNGFHKHVRLCLPSVSLSTAQRRMEEFQQAERLFTGPVVQELIGMGYSPIGEELVEARRLTGPASGDPKKAAHDIVQFAKERRQRVAKARRDGKIPKAKKKERKTTAASEDMEQFAIDIYRVIVARLKQVAGAKRRAVLEDGVGPALTKLGISSTITIKPEAVKEGFDPKVGRPQLAVAKAAN